MKSIHPITIFWLGFLVAISFFEAPLKFQAPSIELEEGLSIGRLVFHWLNKVEIVCFVVLALSLLKIKETNLIKLLIGSLGVLLILQTFWLLPALDQRAQVYIDGGIPVQSNLHLIYVIFEVVKVILLVWLTKAQLQTYKTRLVNS